ncbi:hypothetical protein [Cellulosimicrobium sp. CUA-896]|uniref:hypothetical protein n=1 Tax=Cellulosimicrobium sp. CUA-896 TaxID=1517881 RepID=UPI00210074CD|nr:hypothetical protein [Cellulosimicrobium sp. CUA-896]
MREIAAARALPSWGPLALGLGGVLPRGAALRVLARLRRARRRPRVLLSAGRLDRPATRTSSSWPARCGSRSTSSTSAGGARSPRGTTSCTCTGPTT